MTNHYKSIVVAVDGSKQAEYAFRKGIDVVKRNEGSVLNIVNIIDISSFSAIKSYDNSIVEKVMAQSEKLLNDYKVQVETEGINIKTIIEYRSPKNNHYKRNC